jgi:hypothetical protein
METHKTSSLDAFPLFYEDVAPTTNLILFKTKTERRVDALNDLRKGLIRKANIWKSYSVKFWFSATG